MLRANPLMTKATRPCEPFSSENDNTTELGNSFLVCSRRHAGARPQAPLPPPPTPSPPSPPSPLNPPRSPGAAPGWTILREDDEGPHLRSLHRTLKRLTAHKVRRLDPRIVPENLDASRDVAFRSEDSTAFVGTLVRFPLDHSVGVRAMVSIEDGVAS